MATVHSWDTLSSIALYQPRAHCELISGTKHILSMCLCLDQLIRMSRKYQQQYLFCSILLPQQTAFNSTMTATINCFETKIMYCLPRLTKKGDIHYEALLGNLKPHMAYMIRIAAFNQIDRSAFTEPVVVKTQEEGKSGICRSGTHCQLSLKEIFYFTILYIYSTFLAPSEAPSSVHVNAGGAGELHVSWKPPPRDSWHGELLGYSVSCTELGRAEPQARNATR